MLILLRKVVNHPLMIEESILAKHKINPNSQKTINASGKFVALKQLFVDLGFEITCEDSNDDLFDNNNNNDSTALDNYNGKQKQQ